MPNDAIDQLLVDDPDGDGAQQAATLACGFTSRLTLPVTDGGVRGGTLQAFATSGRPWTRFEIRRARLVALALGATLTRTGTTDAAPTDGPHRTAVDRLVPTP